MDRQQEETQRPRLALQLIPWQPGLLKLRVENFGTGPALSVKGRIETVLKEGDPVGFDWSYHFLGSGRYEEFGFPMPAGASNEARFRLDEIRKRVSKVFGDFSYGSVSGRQYEMKEALDVDNITDDWVTSRMMATQDHPERLLPRIAKALEDLALAHTSRSP
jgi:hypothetical protein